MIIDLIIDRKDGANVRIVDGKMYTTPQYDAGTFYRRARQYGDISDTIIDAMDNGTEDDVRRALYKYIADNDYNLNICTYIAGVEWLA